MSDLFKGKKAFLTIPFAALIDEVVTSQARARKQIEKMILGA